MPADKHFETAAEALRRSPGFSPVREHNPWGDVPDHLRLDWCRALLDFPTFFPGPTAMAFTARIIRSDRVATVHQWAWQADDFHRIGFAAADWYLLRLCVDRRLDKLLDLEDGRFVADTQRFGYRSIALIAEHWTDWMPLLRSGVTPKRALDLIVDGNRSSWPGGAIIDRNGNVLMTS